MLFFMDSAVLQKLRWIWLLFILEHNDTRDRRCEGYKGEHGAFAQPTNLSIRLRPIRSYDFYWTDAPSAKYLKGLVTTLGFHRRLVPRPIARLICVGVFHSHRKFFERPLTFAPKIWYNTKCPQ